MTLRSNRIHESNEENESDEKMVSELRSELWEKEMKLTDIRLEALSSAHQLEQLRETMNNMQVSDWFSNVLVLRCGHIYLCSANLHGQNPVI